MKKILNRCLIAGSALVLCGAAMAKLTPPTLTDEAKAKAAEAAAKTAWSAKVAAFQSCKAQDKVAAQYFKTAKAAGKETRPPAALPPCADPGAFVYTPPVAAKPLEASGAHSPAPTATSPPSTQTPAAALAPAKK